MKVGGNSGGVNNGQSGDGFLGRGSEPPGKMLEHTSGVMEKSVNFNVNGFRIWEDMEMHKTAVM